MKFDSKTQSHLQIPLGSATMTSVTLSHSKCAAASPRWPSLVVTPRSPNLGALLNAEQPSFPKWLSRLSYKLIHNDFDQVSFQSPSPSSRRAQSVAQPKALLSHELLIFAAATQQNRGGARAGSSKRASAVKEVRRRGGEHDEEGADNEGSGTVAGTPGSSKRASAVKEVRSRGGERDEVGTHNVGSCTSASEQISGERRPAGKSEQEGTITLGSSSEEEGQTNARNVSFVWISSESSCDQEGCHQGGNDNGQERADSGKSNPASNRVTNVSEAASLARPSTPVRE